MEKSLTAFKEVVTKIKSQLHEKRDEELATSSDVNFALTNLFRDTGLAKVSFYSVVSLLLPLVAFSYWTGEELCSRMHEASK